MKKKLRIAINAQIPSGSGAGGIETVLRFLTSLNRLDGDEEYVFVGHCSDSDWLKPLLGERQTLVRAPQPETRRKLNRTETLKNALGSLRPLAGNLKRFILSSPKTSTGVAASGGFFENLNCDVVHFPYQDYVRCQLPTVFNPHDLQHLHYPGFFAAEEFKRREILYPAACRAADIVIVASQFVKQDVMRSYETESDKIQVIPWSPPKAEANEFTEKDVKFLFDKYKCPQRPYILYPAMTWEHKNHIRLLEAVALLRDRENFKVNVICTGHKNSFYQRIEERLDQLNLKDQVMFTGIVDREELNLFYRRAQFVIVPTLFEAASAPLFEAWQHDVAVACSSVTSLPEQAADAALLFDAFSVEEIAAAIKRMWFDESLRDDFRARGSKRLKTFDPTLTAKAYRAVYRKAAGFVLNDEDRHLLNWDWMRDSQQ